MVSAAIARGFELSHKGGISCSHNSLLLLIELLFLSALQRETEHCAGIFRRRDEVREVRLIEIINHEVPEMVGKYSGWVIRDHLFRAFRGDLQ